MTTPRFPTPAFPDDGMTLSKADWKLSPKAFQKKRQAVADALATFLPNRFVMVVGVTKTIQVVAGEESNDENSMHTGRAYQLSRQDFVRLKMDPLTSPYVLCLEPKVPNMYFEVSRALNKLYPQQARNTFLAAA